MSNEELIQLSDSLKVKEENEPTYFEVVRDAEEEKHYVRANRTGLLYAAGELLFAAAVMKSGKEGGPQRLSYTFDWEEIESEQSIFLEHAELVNESGEGIAAEPAQITLKDRLTGWGLAIAVILGLTTMIIGIITIAQWVMANI